MDQRTFKSIDRRLGRRSVIRGAAVGAGAVGLGLSGAGRFGSLAWAQEQARRGALKYPHGHPRR